MAPSPERRPPAEAWPRAFSVIASLAVAATIGFAQVLLALDVAGGAIGGRLLAVLPVYFLAAFLLAQAAFWLLRWLVAGASAALGRGGLGARGHGAVVLLTFLAAALLHYSENAGLHRLAGEPGAAPAAPASCPPGLACAPVRSADELKQADVAERRAAAESGMLTADRFARLLRDADPAVRAALARRADLPAELLERLAGDRSAVVREAVAASLRLSDESFGRLAFDREPRVRLAVARNRNAPPTALALLASSAATEVRLLVAAHPRADAPALQRLLDGRGDSAERLARERLAGAAARGETAPP